MNILCQQITALAQEGDNIAMLANISACLWQELKDINWVGFYLYKNNELVLGPFQGKVACTHIPIQKGVCGTSAYNKATIIVEDVHQFPGHIACDSASNSEIVIPLIKENTLIGVLDIDSSKFKRFNRNDKILFEQIAQIISDNYHME